MSMNHAKLFPFAVVPMLAFSDTGFADVDAYLTAVFGVDKLGEGVAVVTVHLHGIFEFVCWQISQIQGKQLFVNFLLGSAFNAMQALSIKL